MAHLCEVHKASPGRIAGASPATAEDYVLVMFDISSQKKYRMLVKTLKKYGRRVQKSVFEAQLTKAKFKALEKSVFALMSNDGFYDESDSVRIYRIAGNCDSVVYGSYGSAIVEENVIL